MRGSYTIPCIGIALIIMLTVPGSFRQCLADIGTAPPGDSIDTSSCGEALPTEALGRLTGMQETQIDRLNLYASRVDITPTLKDNELVSTLTGFNTVGQEAFTNMNGIATVIQNTGNQVIINNSLILNLSLK